jgi:hypothetical protein
MYVHLAWIPCQHGSPAAQSACLRHCFGATATPLDQAPALMSMSGVLIEHPNDTPSIQDVMSATMTCHAVILSAPSCELQVPGP